MPPYRTIPSNEEPAVLNLKNKLAYISKLFPVSYFLYLGLAE
jgi:hypothetical protein